MTIPSMDHLLVPVGHEISEKVLNSFPLWSLVKAMSADGGHLTGISGSPGTKKYSPKKHQRTIPQN